MLQGRFVESLSQIVVVSHFILGGYFWTANIDTAEVGWYTTSYGDNVFLQSETIDAQFMWQRRNPKSVMLVFDPFRTMLEGASGVSPLALHAYRLSAEFLALYKTGKFTTESILEHNVSYKHIFEEIPIYLRPAFPSAIGSLLQLAEVEPELQSDRSVLDTTISPLIERSVEFLVDKFDQMEQLQTRFAGLQRTFNTLYRRYVCIPSFICCYLLFFACVSVSFMLVSPFLSPNQQKLGQEVQVPFQRPPQLDNLLLTSQMTSFCEQTISAAADSTAKLYFVNDILKGKK